MGKGSDKYQLQNISKSTNKEFEIQFWSLRLGCTQEELTNAFQAVGIPKSKINIILKTKSAKLGSSVTFRSDKLIL